MREQITHKTLDEERALYNLEHADVLDCTFAGPRDGESALKEARDVTVERCSFSLRYPLWHAQGYRLRRCTLDELTRAAIWYAGDGEAEDCTLHGIKCLRECDRTTLRRCHIQSPEFAWRCRKVQVEDCDLVSEYPFFESRDLDIEGLRMQGKYSFQYVENARIRHSELDTKDAFWHSRNVTVEHSTVRGEYLGWYSEGLTLIDCKIIGTQPLCYCKGLKLVDCTMEGTDLAFEYSEVEATIRGSILSVKNPKSGSIVCDGVGEVLYEDSILDAQGQVIVRA